MLGEQVSGVADRTQPAAVVGVGLWRQSSADALLVGASVVHGVVFVAVALTAGAMLPGAIGVAVVGFGVWWGSNTVAHNFLHLPFFRSRLLNRCYGIYLSLLLGIPQSLWRQRHLAHHDRQRSQIDLDGVFVGDSVAVIALWAILLTLLPNFFFFVYLPGFVLGLALCALQGHFEHAPTTASHYGTLYNRLFFNDGFHVEHHAQPECHWTSLADSARTARASRYPPVLRGLEGAGLNGLERVVLRSAALRRWVLSRHADAFAHVLGDVSPVDTITIVGGGLFPRSLMLLRARYPDARIRVVDRSRQSLDVAQAFLTRSGFSGSVEFRCTEFENESFDTEVDLLVLPLSFVGDRDACYAHPAARRVLIHDWCWRRATPKSRIVSLWLLKRINLVTA